jgi:predicted metal-dependent HD superfamily phosphohydrolase
MDLKRWINLMHNMGLPASTECYESLLAAYSESHRHYHNVKHIESMLAHFDCVSDTLQQPFELELAIWFHDAVYDPFSSTNEQDSANWAKDFLLRVNYQEAGAGRVYEHIMATMHTAKNTDQHERLIVDIDLSILGSSREQYDEFEKNIRKEYRLVPGFIYHAKRKQILNMFLSLPRIYSTDYFHEKYEELARANLRRALKLL